MKKTGIIITFLFAAVLAIGGFIFSQLSYKICWRCDADDYFSRGLDYTCSDKKSYRRTGLNFIGNAAGQGHIKAELTLAELYSDTLPQEYILSNPEQITCLRQDVVPDQTTGMSYFESVIGAVEQGQEVGPVTLNNLGLLYLENIIAADDRIGKATLLYEKAAVAGSFPAMTQLGRLSNDRGYYAKAMQWFVQASEDQANGLSPLLIGDYYFYGKGTVIDYRKAEEWYSKALARAEQPDEGEENKAQQLLKEMSLARLDMIQRKLSGEEGQKQRVVVNYHVDGSVKHFVIFVADHPEEFIGEVINDGTSISAIMNENLALTAELPESGQTDFSSMNEGLLWVLNTFVTNTHEDAENLIFNFVLTKS